MENASKALILAGEILLGVLLLTLLVVVMRAMGIFSESVNKNIDEKTVSEFNTQFEVYVGRKNLTAQDIISMGNLAKSYNLTDEGTNNKITVKVNGVESKYINLQNLTDEQSYDFIKKYSVDNKNQFECIGVEYSKNTKKVNLVKINLQK